MNELQIIPIIQEHTEWVLTSGSRGKQANFSGSVLKGINFSGIDLRGAFFRGCKIENCLFIGSILEEVLFDASFMSNCIFSPSKFRGASFLNCEMFNCLFGEISKDSLPLLWIFSKFKNLKPYIHDMGSSDLTDCNFSSSLIKNCCFKGAKADGISLNYCFNIKTNYEKVRMIGSSAKNSKFIECSLKNISISNSDWSGANFDRTDISGVDFGVSTNTSGAFFHNAFLSVSEAFDNDKLKGRVFS